MKKIALTVAALIMGVFATFAQTIPSCPNQNSHVNDLAGMLSSDDAASIENILSAVDQLAKVSVATVSDLDGADIDTYAAKMANEWGIGEAGKNNGALILIKQKTADSDGGVAIKAGSGLKEVLTNDVVNEIVNNDLVANFKNGEYGKGIIAAANSIAQKVTAANEAAQKVAAEAAAQAQQATAEATTASSGIPTWVWIVLGIVVLGLIAFFVMKKK